MRTNWPENTLVAKKGLDTGVNVEGELINRMPRDRKYNCQLVVNAWGGQLSQLGMLRSGGGQYVNCCVLTTPTEKGTDNYFNFYSEVEENGGIFRCLFSHPQTRAWSSSFHRTRRNPWSRSHPTKRQWCLAKYIFKNVAVLLHSNIITSSNSSMIPY